MMTLIKGPYSLSSFDYFVNIANQLMSSGLNLNYKTITYDGHYITPYNYAQMCGYKRIAQYLTDHGADPQFDSKEI